MKRFKALLAITAILALIAVPVAVAASSGYQLDINLNNTGAALTNTPFIATYNVNSLTNGHYLLASGLDGVVKDSGESAPTMLTTSQILWFGSADGVGSKQVEFTTGNTPASSMPIIVGNNGYVTIADNAALEAGSHFSKTVVGYLNTTAGANKYIINKPGAIQTYVDATTSGTITALIPTTGSLISPSSTTSAVSWANPSYAYDANATTYTAYVDVAGYQSTVATLGNAGIICNQIQYKAETTAAGDAITIEVYYGSAWHTVVNHSTNVNDGYATPGTWTAALPTFPTAQVCTAIRFQFFGTGYSDFYQMFELYYSNQPAVTITGVPSGRATVTASLASGTFTLSATPDGSSAITASTSFAGSVPNTSNAEVIDQSNVMPYIDSYIETVNGTEVLKYQPVAIISGTALLDRDNTQNGVITFGANPSGITTTIGGLTPTAPTVYGAGNYGAFNNGGAGTINLQNPLAPNQLYTELDASKVPFGSTINELLNEGGVPQALWWFPFIFVGAVIIGMLVYDATQRTGGQGSLLTMCITIEILLVLFGVMGVTGVSGMIPLWTALLFPIPAVALILSRRHVGWG